MIVFTSERTLTASATGYVTQESPLVTVFADGTTMFYFALVQE